MPQHRRRLRRLHHVLERFLLHIRLVEFYGHLRLFGYPCVIALNSVSRQSARGLAQSKTLARGSESVGHRLSQSPMFKCRSSHSSRTISKPVLSPSFLYPRPCELTYRQPPVCHHGSTANQLLFP